MIAVNLEREETIITHLEDIWRTTFVPQFVPNSCVLASRVANEVFDYFGIPNEVIPVSAIAMNEKMDNYWKQSVPMEQWEDDAYSVGVMPDIRITPNGIDRRDGMGFEGHLIVTTPSYLLDLSALQFHRPKYNIVTNGPLIVSRQAVTTAIVGGTRTFSKIILEQGMILYEPLKNYTFLKSQDWKKGYREPSSFIIRAIKPILTKLKETSNG